MKRYALISVSDKNGIDLLASGLVKLGFEIISTGWTAKFLMKMDIPTTQVADWTGFPEIMDGRVKTLHPMVHGGILADTDIPAHVEQMEKLGIKPIEIIAVNLYPFAQTVANPASTEEQIIENIDIGGPTLIRSAAKNFRHATILTSVDDYAKTLSQLRKTGQTDLAWRRELAYKAFAHVEEYDKAISEYFARTTVKSTHDKAVEIQAPERLQIDVPLAQSLRYGENPHQIGGYYSRSTDGWTVLHGKPLSYNNLLDVDAALKAILLFDKTTAMIFKHTNPCGIATGDTLEAAYQKAFATDPLSPFGGIIIVNRKLDMPTVHKINEIFSEIILAPDYEPEALAQLKKRKDRRLISFDVAKLVSDRPALEMKSIISGYLAQEWDKTIISEEGWQVVTQSQPSSDEYDALRFAWRAASLLKSNAIAITGKDMTYGLGMGQTSRVDSTEIAIRKATQFKHDLSAAVCASDGFFTFPDSIELLAKHGIKAVIQPGGSKGDEDVIAACNALGISMVMTGVRHFRH